MTPDAAYDYVADITRHPEWAMDDMNVETLEPGKRYRATAPFFGRPNPSDLTVTTAQRPARFGFDAQDRQGITHHEFRFTAAGGGTVIEREMTGVRQPWFGPILAVVFRGAINKNFNGAMEKLKTRLEAQRS